jgi:flagellar M-ring protein FliF
MTSSGNKNAACSVIPTIKDGATLTKSEAKAIAEVVRNAIQGISYENITIADSNFNLYTVSETEDEPVPVPEPDIEIKTKLMLEDMLRQQMQAWVLQLLAPAFGIDNVQATANVRINFDRVVVETVKFDAPVEGELDGIVRSMSEMFERQIGDTVAEGVPGTDTNGMGTVEYPYGDLSDSDKYSRQVTEKNYEINETRTLIEQQHGVIESLNIGVLINSDAMKDDYTGDLAELISKGMGVSPQNVKVVGVPFPKEEEVADDTAESDAEYKAQMERDRFRQTLVMWGVILLLGIALMLLIRAVVRSLHPPPEPVPLLAGGPLMEELEIEDLTGGTEDMDADESVGVEYMADEEIEITDVTDVEEVELNKKSAGLEQIERFIDKDPAAVGMLLKNWLSDEQ